jgi:hypothetical protein
MMEHITFLDKDGKMTDKDAAVSFIWSERDENGDTVSEVFGKMG